MKLSLIAPLALALPTLLANGTTGAKAGRAHPTPTPSRTPTPASTATVTSTATPSATPSVTGTAVPTTSATVSVSPTATASPIPGYNGVQAAAYADQYWSTYNAQWPSFATTGGDCTNFLSQALYSGGIAMRPASTYAGTAAWFMTGGPTAWSYSTSWVNANDNTSFLGTGLKATKIGTYTGIAPGVTQSSGASEGDAIAYDWNGDGVVDHEAIVVSPDGQLVDAHTNNRYHAYWTLAAYNAQWQTTVITVYHITAGTR